MTAVDLFAGAGGFSTGARAAGIHVVWAANHWLAAVETHSANHPGTHHVCQDLHQANWLDVPKHDLLLSSPSCQGHSKARGSDKPHHDAARSTAWAVISCAEAHRPKVIVVENVPEFLHWQLYPAWELALCRLGYALRAQIINAADHGVPQHRRRVFIVAVRGRKPLALDLPQREHVPVSTLLENGAGFQPAFEHDRRRGARATWRNVGTLCRNTQTKIANGRRQHGRKFLIAYYGNEKGGRSIDRPLGTVTTRDRYALIDGNFSRMLTVGEYRTAMGFPADYILPQNSTLAKHMLGNAVCPPVVTDLLNAIQAML